MKLETAKKVIKLASRISVLAILFLVIDMLISRHAFAWGPGVHTVIALRSLDAASGFLSGIGSVILSNPLEYLYGSLAADFFLMKRHLKSTRHAHHWKGGFALLEQATADKEKAYAYGFLAHLAADVVAHNVFIPTLANIFPNKRRGTHLAWEIRADYAVGPMYTSIAKEVLVTDQKACDDILRSVTSKRKNGLKTRKKIYTQSVKISDYLYGAVPNLFTGTTFRWEGFKEYTLRIVSVSFLFVCEFLQDPYHSLCLKYDPNGKGRLGRLRSRGLLARVLRPKRPYSSMPGGGSIYRI
ncbi:MAG: hypothetical protein DRH15_04660 [Deltaproteobacteria bacterium]|nr:MAG: hypothetical protein DRH15_04660 [Deltaproteobacteria bacterium]